MGNVISPKDAVAALLLQAEDFAWPHDFDVRGFFGDLLDGFRRNADIEAIEKDAVTKGVNLYAAHAMAWCASAIFEDERGNNFEAWKDALDANYFYGIALGLSDDRRDAKSPGRHLAELMHAKNTRPQRSIVEDYWRSHVDRKLSAQKAATAIEQAGVTTLSHKKIAEIVSALRRKEVVRKA